MDSEVPTTQLSRARLDWTFEDQLLMSRARHYLAWQASLVLPHAGLRVLEVGCGIGNFTGALLGRDAVIAVDPQPEFIAHLRSRYPADSRLHALLHPAETPLATLRPHNADSCVCLNVLEHIPDDRGALRDMAAAITPGGPIILIVPAFPALAGPIDRSLGHCRRYTCASLRRVAAEAGLKVRLMHYLNMPGFFAWWLNFRVLRSAAQSPARIALFDNLAVPVASRVERWLDPPFGQSIFCVLVQ